MKVFVVCWLCIVTLRGVAAPFQNLGFDEANTNNLIGAFELFGPATEMLPGWRLSQDVEENLVGYNVSNFSLDFATLYDISYVEFGAPLPVEGKYALGLWPGGGGTGVGGPYNLSQTGDVPSDAKTIHFVNFSNPFGLRVNGEQVPLIYDYPPDYLPPLFNRHIPVPAVGDISAFAGRTVEMEFITLRPSDPLHGIDSISFSPELIPEAKHMGFAWVGWGVSSFEVEISSLVI